MRINCEIFVTLFICKINRGNFRQFEENTTDGKACMGQLPFPRNFLEIEKIFIKQ